MAYKNGDCTHYARLRDIVYAEYRNKIDQLKLNPKKTVIEEKDRNKCLTTETVHDFFEYKYTEEMLQDIPLQLILNADETSFEVSLQKKVLVLDKKQDAKSIVKLSISSYILAMITFNATGIK